MKARYVTTRRVAAVGATMTNRERAILTTLGTIRVATARQLAGMHCEDLRPRQTRAVLTSLTDRQVLARLRRVVGGARSGSAGYIYTLGPVGVRLLAPTRRGRPWEVSTLFLAHSLAVSQLYTDLVLSARLGTYELASFAGEPACWRPFYGLGGEQIVLKPDAYLKLRVDGFLDHWFIELDLGTESRSIIARKAETYRRYWLQADARVMPRVLFVVPDEPRRAVITGVLGRQPAEAWDLFQVTTMNEAVNRLAQGAGV